MGIAFRLLLNNEFTIFRRDRIPDGRGGWTLYWAQVGTVRGRLRPANSNERMVADSEERQITHVLYTVAGADVARGDRVACAGPTCVHVIEVEIQGIREPSATGHHWEIDCLERQLEASLEMGS